MVLPQRGIIQVVGDNQVGHGRLASIGSGKSAFGDAIHRCVFGVEGRKTGIRKFSTSEEGNTYVRVEGTLGGAPLVVEMGYKCRELSRSGEGLRFALGEKPAIEREHIRLTREELNKTLGMTPALAAWTVCLDGDRLKFNQLSQAETVDILMNARQEPPWTLYHERSRVVFSEFSEGVQAATGTLSQAKTAAQQAQAQHASAAGALLEARRVYHLRAETHAAALRSASAQLSALEKQVLLYQQQKKEIRTEIKKLEQAASAATAKLEIKRLEWVSHNAALERKREPLLEARAQARHDAQIATTALQALKLAPDQCPTCGALRKAAPPQEIKRATLAVETAQRKLALSEEQVLAANQEISGVRARQLELSRAIADSQIPRIEEESRRYEQLDEEELAHTQKRDACREQVLALKRGPDDTGLRRAQTIVEERQRALDAARQAIEAAAAALNECEIAVRVGEYWKEAFSPVGIPNMILRESVAPLNAWASQISSKLTGGALLVEFGTARVLADGREKSELTIRVVNRHGSADADLTSKGESGLVNLIIAETLASIGSVQNRIAYRWFDEVINPFCASARRSFLSALAAQCRDRVAFVVDHHAEVDTFATGVLLARKTPHGTEIVPG